MKKLKKLSLLFILIGILAVGCQIEKNSESVSSTETQQQGGISLKAWIIANTALAEPFFVQTLEPYMEQHNNITIDIKVLSWDTAWSDITSAITSGEGPDIVQLGTTWVPAIASMNGLDDLTNRVGEVGGGEAYLPASWKTTMIEGKPNVYAVPWFVDARVLFYRKDAFQAAGVDPNTAFQDWSSFKEALQKVNGIEINGQKMTALGVPGKNDWNVAHNILPWMWSAGAEVLTPDNKSAVFNDKQALEGIMYYTGLAQDGLVDLASLGKNSSQIENDFADGKTAALVSGPWLLKDFEISRDNGGLGGVIDKANIGLAPLPMGPEKRSTFIGGSNLAVFQTSKHKDAAWELIRYLSSDEAQLAYSKRLGMLPAKRSLLDSKAPIEELGYAAFAEATKYGQTYPSIPQWGSIETALVKHFGEIWSIAADQTGRYSEEAVQEQLDAAVREIDIILAQ
ncbi:multiple sugar transport system substrate-binding protein [Paenibacillus castaneae]|uniref:sugar ABC transporter substrate-binding protein n=1 Tax=Paenibacillus castaneae TaxID=474957 RepID=UPI001FB9D146|nr:sugar ABC transporter substrate-binding protein [Paenibacillus castaneae]NIK77839.1 multiple sugar transport system substrate-binding protein [Paenibacillus castaneae]